MKGKKKGIEGMKKAASKLSEKMSEMMGDDVKEKLKDHIAVKVVAKSPKDAVKGLSKAQELLKARMEDGGMAEDLKGNSTKSYGKEDYFNKKSKK
jgi:hypothetical protein